MTRRFAFAVAGAALLLSLTACTAATTTDATPSPTPVPSDSPAAPPASADPAAEAVADATCDDVLTADEYASLASDGLTIRPDDAFPLGPAMADLIDDGALHCTWAGEQGDVAVWFAQLPEADDGWATREAELLATGWTRGDDPLPGTLTAPADYDGNYVPSVVHVDGVTYFVSYAGFFASVAALS